MFTPLRGLKLGRRAVVVGFVLAGASATAAAAASGNPIWQGASRPFAAADQPPSTDAPPATDPQPAAAEPESAPPPPTEPPVTDAVVAPVEPTQASDIGPVGTEPAAVEPDPVVTEPVVTEPAVIEPAADTPPATEAPASPPEAKPNDNVVPATLSLSCELASDSASGPVSCAWSGELPDGFAAFVLLRGDPDGKGRVPFRSGDPSASSFLDQTATEGTHSYVLVALDAADHPLAHSNMVHVQIATA